MHSDGLPSNGGSDSKIGLGLNLLPPFLSSLVAFLISFFVTPYVRRWAVAFGFSDRPGAHRAGPPKPRLGGVALYLAFVIATLVISPLVAGRTSLEWQRVWGVLLGATVVFIMGVIDDRVELGPWSQLLGQAVGAIIAVAFGVVISQVTNPFGTALHNSMVEFPWPVAVLFTLFWIVGAMNTINFIDGLDGLAAGVTAIAAAVLAAHSLLLNQYSIAVLPLALLGCTVGFLPHNSYPAKVTMGTSGAAFLGFALGTLSIIGGAKAATVLLVLGVPILDTAWIIFRRLFAGGSPFSADRSHLHHRLLEMGLSVRQIVLLFYGLCATFGSLALLLSSRLLKLYTLGGMVLVLGGILALMAQKRFQKRY